MPGLPASSVHGFAEGADPGIAAVDATAVSSAVVAFGQDAKRLVLTQEQALRLARNAGLLLEPLGGTGGGVIGALAGIGLAATGSDGRYLELGSIRYSARRARSRPRSQPGSPKSSRPTAGP